MVGVLGKMEMVVQYTSKCVPIYFVEAIAKRKMIYESVDAADSNYLQANQKYLQKNTASFEDSNRLSPSNNTLKIWPAAPQQTHPWRLARLSHRHSYSSLAWSFAQTVKTSSRCPGRPSVRSNSSRTRTISPREAADFAKTPGSTDWPPSRPAYESRSCPVRIQTWTCRDWRSFPPCLAPWQLQARLSSTKTRCLSALLGSHGGTLPARRRMLPSRHTSMPTPKLPGQWAQHRDLRIGARRLPLRWNQHHLARKQRRTATPFLRWTRAPFSSSTAGLQLAARNRSLLISLEDDRVAVARQVRSSLRTIWTTHYSNSLLPSAIQIYCVCLPSCASHYSWWHIRCDNKQRLLEGQQHEQYDPQWFFFKDWHDESSTKMNCRRKPAHGALSRCVWQAERQLKASRRSLSMVRHFPLLLTTSLHRYRSISIDRSRLSRALAIYLVSCTWSWLDVRSYTNT